MTQDKKNPYGFFLIVQQKKKKKMRSPRISVCLSVSLSLCFSLSPSQMYLYR